MRYLKYLVENKCSVNQKDPHGSVLYYSSLNPCLETIKLLLDNNVKMFTEGYVLHNIISFHFHANKEETKKVIKHMVLNEADINEMTGDGRTILHLFTEKSYYDMEMIKFLAPKMKNINVRRYSSFTPFLTLCTNQTDIEILKYMIENKSDLNPEYDNPLFHAPIHLSIDCVRYLIERKCDVKYKNNQNETAMYFACLNGNTKKEMIELLIQSNASVNFFNKKRISPLHNSIIHKKDFDIIKLLLDHNANPNFADEKGDTPLVKQILTNCKSDIVLLLACRGAHKIEDPSIMLSQYCQTIMDQISNDALWNPSSNRFFSPENRECVWVFLVSCKIFSKSIHHKIPKPLLYLLIRLFITENIKI